MLYSQHATAALSDTIHPFVLVGYTYDDNLLRLAENFPVEQRSDRITQSQAGIIVDRPFGRQKLTASLKMSRVSFDHFEQLDYNGKDFNADLAWQLGNRLSGNIGGTYTQTLTPFTDLQTDQRNLRKTQRSYVNGAWRFHSSWQLRGSYRRSEFNYELPVQRVNDRTENLAEVGIDFLPASGSRIGLVARQWKGTYNNPRALAGVTVLDDFKQNELKANIYWLATGVTQVTALIGYAKREHTYFPIRDSSGANGRASVKWAPLGKVQFSAEAWREFSAVESLVVNNSLNRGGSLGATWYATGKIQANASVRSEKREFELLSTQVPANVDATDKLRSFQAGLTYAPTLATQLSLSVFREKRDGSAFLGMTSYRANGVSLNASAQF